MKNNTEFFEKDLEKDLNEKSKSRKGIVIFIINIIIIILITVLSINFSGKIAPAFLGFNENAAQVFSVCEFVTNENKKENININDNKNNSKDKTKKSGKTNDTVLSETPFNVDDEKDDKDALSDIAETPEDIARLMTQVEKTIKKEKKTGKTSEEDYFGGGELVSFDGVEVQSKIPSSFYKLNIESLLKQKAELNIKDASKPTVLIYHSHTTESYTLLDTGYYTKSLDPRSDSKEKNMVRVGDDLTAYLEKMGIGVIHDRAIHDESYNSAYASSRKSVEKYLEKYPSIEITIDVHRDDITYKDKTKVKPTAVINGKKAARLMIISGAEYGDIKNFPDWEYNLRFNLAVQKKVNEIYPGLMRPVLFSARKYNMDETRNSFLLEVGTDANTLDEACYSARLFAAALAELIRNDYTQK